MNHFFVLCLVVVAVSVHEGYGASLRNKRQVIPREFQNINIENYLKNERAVRFQLKCIIDDGPCDRIGKYLKVTIPELLVNQCANCDTAQRERAGKLVSHIQQNFPEEWERAVKKFQGGQLVKPDDAARLETLLGVKLNPNLVGEASTTAAPVSSTPEAKPAEVPSTSPIPVSSSSSAAPATSSSSEAPASSSTVAAISSSSAAPETSSIAAAVSSTTVAAVAPSSTTAAAVSSSTSEASSSTTAAAVSSSSAAPAA